MADHLRAELVVDALAMAVARRQPAADLVYHSDRGVQSTSLAFGAAVRAAGILPSMGSVVDCDDTAQAALNLAESTLRRHRSAGAGGMVKPSR